jgi:hypothetical protein
VSRKGRRLAVALSPRWPRWGSLVLGTFVVIGFAAPLLGFFYFAGDEYDPFRAKLYSVVVGGFLLVCVVGWVREFVRWLLAGRAQVEVSLEPVSPGQDLEYYVFLSRDYSSMREFEARILCRRQILRHPVEELVSVVLAPPEIDPSGRKAISRGTLRFPDGPASAVVSHELTVEWVIRIRAIFGNNAPFIEEFPFRVVVPSSP